MNQKGISKLVIIIIAALLLIILVGGGAAAYLIMFRPPVSPEDLKPDALVAFPLDQFRVNVAGTEYSQFLMTTVVLAYSHEAKDLGAELEERKPQIHDIVDGILSSWTLEEFSADTDRKKLKKEMLKEINEILKEGEIEDVYITELIIQ